MDIQVDQLEVTVYIPIECSKHLWDLSVLPVMNCPYYLCLKNDDRSIYDKYMDLISKRHPEAKNPEAKSKYSYDYFMGLVEGIRRDGSYKSDKAGSEPMRIFKGTSWLLDGHHRAAIICALFGPTTVVPVKEVDDARPEDLDLCANPCKD